MPPIRPGDSFPNLVDFKEALRQWAIEGNWTPAILDSDSHRVRAGCRSRPGCPFRIRANYSAKRGDARVTTVEDKHDCAPLEGEGPSQRAHQNIKRAETGKLKFLLQVVPSIMNVTLDTSIHEIISVVEQKFGQKIPTRQAQKVKSALVTRVKGPCRHCHRMGHTRRQCSQLKASAPGPMDFSQNDSTMDFSRDGDGGQDYSQGMDDTFGDGDMSYNNESGHYEQQHNQQNNVDPSLENGVEPDYAPSPIPPRAPLPLPASSTTPLTLQGARTSFPQQVGLLPLTTNTQNGDLNPVSPIRVAARTNAEKRSEASRLMQQATALMQRAAAMNTEASRLLASLSEGP